MPFKSHPKVIDSNVKYRSPKPLTPEVPSKRCEAIKIKKNMQRHPRNFQNTKNHPGITIIYSNQNHDPKASKNHFEMKAAGLDQRPLTRREIVRCERSAIVWPLMSCHFTFVGGVHLKHVHVYSFDIWYYISAGSIHHRCFLVLVSSAIQLDQEWVAS